MADRRAVKRAIDGQLVRGREGERIAVALRALGVPCVITPDLAQRLKNKRIHPQSGVTHPKPRTGTQHRDDLVA